MIKRQHINQSSDLIVEDNLNEKKDTNSTDGLVDNPGASFIPFYSGFGWAKFIRFSPE